MRFCLPTQSLFVGLLCALSLSANAWAAKSSTAKKNLPVKIASSSASHKQVKKSVSPNKEKQKQTRLSSKPSPLRSSKASRTSPSASTAKPLKVQKAKMPSGEPVQIHSLRSLAPVTLTRIVTLNDQSSPLTQWSLSTALPWAGLLASAPNSPNFEESAASQLPALAFTPSAQKSPTSAPITPSAEIAPPSVQAAITATALGLANANGETEAYTDRVDSLLSKGFSYLGVKYKLGGTSAFTGFDCSGFVQHVFSATMGLDLPRTAREMADVGVQMNTPEDLRPGDLVFFNTMRRAFSHVGIYIGEGRFVHSPSAGGRVRIDALSNSYWVKRFNGARRILKPER